jgi:hypothetical protein
MFKYFLYSFIGLLLFFGLLFPSIVHAFGMPMGSVNWDIYPVGSLTVPWYAFGSSPVLPSVIDTFSMGSDGHSLALVGGSTTFPRARIGNQLPASISDSVGAYFYAGPTSVQSFVLGVGDSTDATNYIIYYADGDTISVSYSGGTDVFTGISHDVWHYMSLTWDNVNAKIRGCLDGSCTAWFTPSYTLQPTDTYLYIYGGSTGTGATKTIYIDDVGGEFYDPSPNLTNPFTTGYVSSTLPVFTFPDVPTGLGSPWDEILGWLLDQLEAVINWSISFISWLFVPSQSSLQAFSTHLTAFSGKFPFNFLTSVYGLFFNFTLPSVDPPTFNVSVFGVSIPFFSYTWLSSTSITVPGTATTLSVLAFFRILFILAIWFFIIEFLVWWATSLFGKK